MIVPRHFWIQFVTSPGKVQAISAAPGPDGCLLVVVAHPDNLDGVPSDRIAKGYAQAWYAITAVLDEPERIYARQLKGVTDIGDLVTTEPPCLCTVPLEIRYDPSTWPQCHLHPSRGLQ